MNWTTIAKLTLTLAAAATTLGCVSVANSQSDGTDVRLGQAFNVDGPMVKALAVLEDSRCPTNTQCVWAGQVRLKMLWLRPSGDEEFELTLGASKPIADGAIALNTVKPEKTTASKIKPEDYRFSFSFSGGL